jgi:microcystin-dependent protein
MPDGRIKISAMDPKGSAPGIEDIFELAAVSGTEYASVNVSYGEIKTDIVNTVLTAVSGLIPDIPPPIIIPPSGDTVISGSQFENLSVGTVVPHMNDEVPNSWLECNGQTISRALYPELFNTIGTRYGNGDGLTTFNVPDLRGEFLRGWDHGRGKDPDIFSRTDSGDGTTGDNVGTKQTDDFRSHTHNINRRHTADNNGPEIESSGGGINVSDAVTRSTGGNETQPTNIAVMYIIKASIISFLDTAVTIADTFIISDIKNSGPSLSGYTANTRITRDLNTVKQSQSWAISGNNQFTLTPGKYRIHAYTHWHNGSDQTVQASIYDLTNNETLQMNADRSSSSSREPIRLNTPVFIGENTTYEIGFISESNQGVDAGGDLLVMDSEVEYTRVEVEKLG